MKRRVLLGMTITLALAALPVTASAQAAAESALTNAHSASSTVGAASALNRALKQSGNQLAGRIQEQTSKSRQSGVRLNEQKPELQSQAGGGRVRADSVPGNVVTSIQGAEVNCAPSRLKTQPPAGTEVEPRQTDCRSKDPSPNPGSQDKSKNNYKSVITLSFPK
jgi:TolA-binding protein